MSTFQKQNTVACSQEQNAIGPLDTSIASSSPGWNIHVVVAHVSEMRPPTGLFEISSSHGGEYEVQICLLGCTAV
jgi:hypothetical protein